MGITSPLMSWGRSKRNTKRDPSLCCALGLTVKHLGSTSLLMSCLWGRIHTMIKRFLQQLGQAVP